MKMDFSPTASPSQTSMSWTDTYESVATTYETVIREDLGEEPFDEEDFLMVDHETVGSEVLLPKPGERSAMRTAEEPFVLVETMESTVQVLPCSPKFHEPVESYMHAGASRDPARASEGQTSPEAT